MLRQVSRHSLAGSESFMALYFMGCSVFLLSISSTKPHTVLDTNNNNKVRPEAKKKKKSIMFFIVKSHFHVW